MDHEFKYIVCWASYVFKFMIHVEDGIKIPKNVKEIWNWVVGRGWNGLEGSEEDRKMCKGL